MADLSKYWRREYASISAEYDQKAMLAMEMIAEYFSENEDDSEKLRGIINFFATDDRVTMSIIGILAQVGLYAIMMDGVKPTEELS